MQKNPCSVWDEWNRSGGPKYPHTKVVQFLFRMFPNPSLRANLDVLDLGCGSGVHMVFLESESFKAHGRDISPFAIDNTSRRMQQAGLKPSSLMVSSVENIAADSDSMDAVICVGVLDAAGSNCLASAFAEIARVLKQGGVACCLFASNLDMRVHGENPFKIYGFSDSEVLAAIDPIRSKLDAIWIDRYISTYENQKNEQNEHLITLFKS
jgi:ubiquinone/menaquinone biosynthesis C-methylase UbiE